MTFLILNNDIIKHEGVAGKHCEWLLNATNSLINKCTGKRFGFVYSQLDSSMVNKCSYSVLKNLALNPSSLCI